VIDIYTRTKTTEAELFDQCHDYMNWFEHQARLAGALGFKTYVEGNCLFVLDNDELNRIYFADTGEEIEDDFIESY